MCTLENIETFLCLSSFTFYNVFERQFSTVEFNKNHIFVWINWCFINRFSAVELSLNHLNVLCQVTLLSLKYCDGMGSGRNKISRHFPSGNLDLIFLIFFIFLIFLMLS